MGLLLGREAACFSDHHPGSLLSVPSMPVGRREGRHFLRGTSLHIWDSEAPFSFPVGVLTLELNASPSTG